ncbi:ATP-binding response regulator [Azoarcus indigens]|uniref:Response regulator receiver domain-containing protein n=1 Tax=Azoarcus indigens TaxID=29545 RepID=A0A4R6DRU3_9RHOO|nr:response regulator [Azoarcus indigens]TDN47766.1 response regulator receiver domain-containing protein [Azoarcus indigens]
METPGHTPPSPASHPPPAHQATLLLVDDEGNILSAMKRLLRRDGYRILSAAGGEEALALLDREAVDVIVSDQRMPGMSGVEFLRRARLCHPHTVRIVLSGYTELQSVTSAINEGAVYKFLTKPWDDEQLRANIAEAFRHKALLDENRRLTDTLAQRNQELAEANLQLQRLLDDREHSITRHRNALAVLQELTELLPWPVVGVDEDELVVALNGRAAALFSTTAGPLGRPLAQALPEHAGLLASLQGDSQIQLNGRRFLAHVRRLAHQPPGRGRTVLLIPGDDPDDIHR